MVKVLVEFRGQDMTQVRADMERWAKGFLGGDTEPPRLRSFAETDVQAGRPQ